MLKRILKSRFVLHSAGRLMASYLKLVQRTNRFTIEPADAGTTVYADMPVIAAMWHGQHFMIPFSRRPQDPSAVMISRHGDGEINAVACAQFGIQAVRGSGAQRKDQVRKRGGAEALRAALKMLASGSTLAMTADVPKISRVAGRGIITLAQLSGRPIVAVAVVTSRRKDFNSWDCSSIGLPFGKGAIVLGSPIHVDRDASPQAQEAARLAVQDQLDAVHARAYAMVASTDPGAGRSGVLAARAKAALQAPDVTAELS